MTTRNHRTQFSLSRGPSVWLAGICIAALANVNALHAQQPFFMGLGVLPFKPEGSRATDVSADGSVVVGWSGRIGSANDREEGFIWTRESGLTALGVQGRNVNGPSLSPDGKVVVLGTTDGNSGLHREVPIQWTRADGAVPLPILADHEDDSISAIDVLSTGEIYGNVNGADYGLRWTSPELPPEDLTRFLGLKDHYWSLSGVSADGSVITGYHYQGNSFIWRRTSEGGELIEILAPEGQQYSAREISADGTTVIGLVSAGGAEVGSFRWTAEGGSELLPPPPGGGRVRFANALSGDGGVIVGSALGPGGLPDSFAFIWDGVHGTRNLADVLRTEYGLTGDLAGWERLGTPTAISDDGRTIVGRGRNPQGISEAWIAFLGDPVVANPADFDADADADGADFLGWQRNVGLTAGATRAQGDANGDGRVDAGDLAIWKSHFGAASQISLKTPVPEPSATTLIGPALVLMLVARPRGRFSPRRATMASVTKTRTDFWRESPT